MFWLFSLTNFSSNTRHFIHRDRLAISTSDVRVDSCARGKPTDWLRWNAIRPRFPLWVIYADPLVKYVATELCG